jgi:MSHA biogenesis protein MshQ
MRIRLLAFLVLGLGASSAFGGTCSSNVATGNWDVGGTWTAGCTGPGGAPAAIDNVTISNGDVITVRANATVNSVTLAGGTANNLSLNLNSNITLNVTTNVTFTASTSNTRTRRIQLGTGAQLLIGGNLTINTGAVTGSIAEVVIGNAANTLLSVGGSITDTGTVAARITFSGAGELRVAGDFQNGFTFAQGTGTVNYNGSGAQNLGTYTYANLAISKSGGTATASGSATATSLNFAAGNAGLVSMTGANTLFISNSCVSSVTRTGNGHVIGNLEYTWPSGTPTCTYHVGDATNYTPVTLAFTGSGGGTLTANVTNADHPQKATWPVSTTRYVRRYWTLGAAGDTLTTFTDYSPTLNWVAGDVLASANYQNFIVGQYRGGWMVPDPTVGTKQATSIAASGITTNFSTATDLVVGEPYQCLPPANAPAGVACVCDNFGRPTLNPSSIFGGNWLLSTSSGAFGIPKIINQGYLRLTDNTGNNSAAATVPGIFPAAGNYISVEFRQYAYNGSGADGIAVTLSDYSVAPTPGAFGGSLGYAQKTGINGFAGGWIGVAMDEYGNYENNTEGRVGTAGGTGLYPDSIGVRGSGSGTTGYPWLAGALNLGNIDNAGSTTPANGYMYQVIVDARNYTPTTRTALVSVNRDTSGTGNTYTGVVAPFDAYVVNPGQASVPVNWQISFTGSTGGATNVHEIGNLKVCAQSLLPPTASTTAASFNAIDSALPNTKQNALFGHIYMKVANVPFTLNVAALLPQVGGVSQGVNTVYASSGGNKTVSVKLFDDSQPGTSCNSSAAACSACAKTQVGTTQTITFTGADGGFKASPAFTVNGAYKRLIAQMTESGSGTTGCSTDAFSVRPATYALSTTISNASPAKAGTPFTITATPANANNGTLLVNAFGAPVLDNTKAPTAGAPPAQTLLQQSWPTGAGAGTFIYNDVGSFTLPVSGIYDPQFGNAAGQAQDRTNGDCNPGSGSPYVPNTCYGYGAGGSCTNASAFAPDSSGKYGCDIGSQALPVTRFYPDHYEASVSATQACAADGFSYMGQPFSMTNASAGAIQIKALAAGQTFATAPGLPSYTGSYTPRANVWFGAQNGIGSATDLIQCIATSQTPTASRCLNTTLPRKAAVSNAWTAGVFTAPAGPFFFDPPKDATTTPDPTWGPYDTLNIGLTVSDSDGSTLTIPGGQSFVLNSDTYQSINGSLPLKMRYGRMRVQNASGSDQVPLAVPVLLEYWNGTAWTPNVLDTACTGLATTPTPFGGNAAPAACYGGGCSSVSAGTVGSIYTARVQNVGANSVGPLTYGSPLFSYGQRNVMLTGPKASGSITMSVAAPAWLKIGPVAPSGANPSGTLRFGTYNSRFIFLRENY